MRESCQFLGPLNRVDNKKPPMDGRFVILVIVDMVWCAHVMTLVESLRRRWDSTGLLSMLR